MKLTQTEAYIRREEGYRRHMYKCPSGKWTIGIGLNLEAGLPDGRAGAHGLHNHHASSGRWSMGRGVSPNAQLPLGHQTDT